MKGYSAFGRRDIPAILDLLADDVEWQFFGDPKTGTPYGGTYRGKQQVAEWFQTLAKSDEILEFEPREFLEGPNHVTVLGRNKGRGLPNGLIVEGNWVHIFTWKDGSQKIARWVGSGDTAGRLATA